MVACGALGYGIERIAYRPAAKRARHGRHHQRPRRVHRAPDRRDPGVRGPVQAGPDQPGSAERLGDHDRRDHDPVRPRCSSWRRAPAAARARVRRAADAVGPGDPGDGAGPRGGGVHGRRRRPRRVARLRDGLGAGRGRRASSSASLYTQVDFAFGFFIGIKAFTAAVIGGIGYIRGALPGRPGARHRREPRHGLHLPHLQGRDHLRAAGRRAPAPAPDRAPRPPLRIREAVATTLAASRRGWLAHVLDRAGTVLRGPPGRRASTAESGAPSGLVLVLAGAGRRGAAVPPARRRRRSGWPSCSPRA